MKRGFEALALISPVGVTVSLALHEMAREIKTGTIGELRRGREESRDHPQLQRLPFVSPP